MFLQLLYTTTIEGPYCTYQNVFSEENVFNCKSHSKWNDMLNISAEVKKWDDTSFKNLQKNLFKALIEAGLSNIYARD